MDGTRRYRCDQMLYLLDSNLARAKGSGLVLCCASSSLLLCSTRKLSGSEVLIPTKHMCHIAPWVNLLVSRWAANNWLLFSFLGCGVLLFFFFSREILQNTCCRLVLLEFSIQTLLPHLKTCCYYVFQVKLIKKRLHRNERSQGWAI